MAAKNIINDSCDSNWSRSRSRCHLVKCAPAPTSEILSLLLLLVFLFLGLKFQNLFYSCQIASMWNLVDSCQSILYLQGLGAGTAIAFPKQPSTCQPKISVWNLDAGAEKSSAYHFILAPWTLTFHVPTTKMFPTFSPLNILWTVWWPSLTVWLWRIQGNSSHMTEPSCLFEKNCFNI